MSEDNNDILKTGEDFISKLEDDHNTQKKVSSITNEDPFMRLKLNLLEFFSSRLNDISKQEELREKIADSFLNDLDNEDEPLTFQQRMQLYKLIASQSSGSADSILSLFKPTPGAPSILAENISKEEKRDDMFDDIYKDMSSEDLQAIDTLMKIMENMKNKKDD